LGIQKDLPVKAKSPRIPPARENKFRILECFILNNVVLPLRHYKYVSGCSLGIDNYNS
jgi:hypothetical protein